MPSNDQNSCDAWSRSSFKPVFVERASLYHQKNCLAWQRDTPKINFSVSVTRSINKNQVLLFATSEVSLQLFYFHFGWVKGVWVKIISFKANCGVVELSLRATENMQNLIPKPKIWKPKYKKNRKIKCEAQKWNDKTEIQSPHVC